MKEVPVSYDPYDLWMTQAGVHARGLYYKGRLLGKLEAVLIALCDWLAPELSRKILGAAKRSYPITISQWILMQDPSALGEVRAGKLLEKLISSAARIDKETASWGLGFPWMSKNGLYSSETPFITHTPYAMEALLHLSTIGGEVSARAVAIFDLTAHFLESLKPMHQTPGRLALSYAPVEEPRIVVNANSYAAYSYALHARRQGEIGNREQALYFKEKAIEITRWIVEQQENNGSWEYYADREPGNFIDCFHSCFVIKNLVKTSLLVAEVGDLSSEAVKKGRDFLHDSFFIEKDGLVQRFTKRDISDPYTWDLYDQAEFLGILIDCGDLEKARQFSDTVSTRFRKDGAYYCKIDFFGRLWGRDFLRWGVMPFLYQRNRLNLLPQSTKE